MSSTRLDEIYAHCVSLAELRKRTTDPYDVNLIDRVAQLRVLVFRGFGNPEEHLRGLLDAAKEEAVRTLLRRRGVNTPCPACEGPGTRWYSSGATWRGGMGTASFATDVCDVCWGTGDAQRHGVNLRELEAARDAWEDTEAVQYFARSLGIRFTGAKERLEELAKLCEKQARKRNIGTADPFWYVQGWEMTAAVLRRIAKGARDE